VAGHRPRHSLTTTQCPRGAVRSARLPVKEKVTGSNPVGGARSIRPARYANRQSGRAQTSVTCGFDSHSCHWSRGWQDAGWCSSRRSVKPLPIPCEAVGERFNSFTTHRDVSTCMARWSIGSGRQPLKLKRRVRFPHGPLLDEQEDRPIAGWRNGRRAGLRSPCPQRVWEFESPLGDCSGPGR
jgi:hypothetical protein